MRFLHTSDWHVGKTLRGRSRLDEHTAVLGEIVQLVTREQPDAVLIAGDVYDSATPSPQAQRLVNRALIALAKTGAQVVVIAGNHDHAGVFEAFRPVMDYAGITLVGRIQPRDQGGLLSFEARSTGEKVNLALLPFLSRRYVVKAEQIVTGDPAANAGRYDESVRLILSDLTAGFTPDAVNVVLGHLTCTGGTLGGGERAAQTIFEYNVPATAFPAAAHYVALGHLHRRQQLAGPCPVHYCGSPIAVDFGEEQNRPVVCLVRASPGAPAEVTDLPITTARRLRTLTGTLSEVLASAAEHDTDWLRVELKEKARAGLKDEVLARLPNAVEVRIHPDFVAVRERTPVDHASNTPAELFGTYLGQAGIGDPRLTALFADLDDELSEAGR